MLSNSILSYRDNVFLRVKEIPFPEVFKVFHNGEMRRQGRYFIALCPFHSEKSPSFTIYDNRFVCYGCGESGDSIKFVSKLHGLRPLEAAKAIAERFGLPTSPLSREDKLRLARAKAERLREKKLREAFKAWVRDTAWQVRTLAEAIRSVMQEQNIDTPLLDQLSIFEYWADTLTEGSEVEIVELYRDKTFWGWFNAGVK